MSDLAQKLKLICFFEITFIQIDWGSGYTSELNLFKLIDQASNLGSSRRSMFVTYLLY